MNDLIFVGGDLHGHTGPLSDEQKKKYRKQYAKVGRVAGCEVYAFEGRKELMNVFEGFIKQQAEYGWSVSDSYGVSMVIDEHIKRLKDHRNSARFLGRF